MSGGVWIPALTVLAIGLAAGLLFAARVRRAAGSTGKGDESAAKALSIADLEARRDDLYQRLREAEAEGADPREIEILEQGAANVLRELDELQDSGPASKSSTGKDGAETVTKSAASASSDPGSRKVSGLSALAIGAGIVAVVGLLIYWAVRDARPDPQRGEALPAAPPSAEMAHQGEGGVSPEVAIRQAGLESRLEEDPTDVAARKELAVLSLQSGQFFEAYKHSDELLRADPSDPDGLYVQGVVRMTMGQDQAAGQLLDGVLASYPDHVLALLARGIVTYRSGSVEEAIAIWERGLEAAGGHHDDIEEMLAMARSQGSPPPEVSRVPVSQTSDLDNGFRIRIEMSAGTSRSAQAGVLFVSLIEEEGMPPAAVRRIVGPQFPLDILLTDSDSMVGDPLPETGLVRVMWDEDGDVSSRGPLDLAASAEAARGKESVVRLGE